MKKKQSIEQLKDEGIVKNASELPIPSKFEYFTYPTIGNHVGYHTTDKNTVEWIVTIEKYCELEGITPLDLILSHKERNKPLKPKKGTKTPKTEENASNDAGSTKKDRSNWFDTYRKSKTGYNP